MKYLSIAALSAVLALGSYAKASAAVITQLYLGSTITDQTLEFSQPFTETLFSPSLMNSIVSATLTSVTPFEAPAATGDVTVDVYLADTNTNTKVLASALTLSLDLSTTTSTTSTTQTSNYPTDFYPGPSGTFNEIVVDVIGSDITHGGLSFTGLIELESVPEPSTWAMLLGGMGVLLVAVRFRRTANI